MVKHSSLRMFILCLGLVSAPAAISASHHSLPGFVIHFDFIENARDGRKLVAIAQRAGAEVINVVPPAHIWENPKSLEMLDAILDEISRRGLQFVFSRIDASYPRNDAGERFNFLYGKILTEPGRLPNGSPTENFFCTTVGRDGYVEWMEDETRYYAKRFGQLPYLIGINLGPFSEPFASERGGFLDYMDATWSYELTQYTDDGRKHWHQWLKSKFKAIENANREYAAAFASFDSVPMPLSESDPQFGRPALAYFDLVSSINDWFADCYDRCQRIWHETSRRKDVPLILQFGGSVSEKLVKGRPSFAAFDLPGWTSKADALGISLYTSTGFPDMCHSSNEATLNLISLGCDQGKDVFVMEGGCEAPNVVLRADELKYFGTVARKLDPRTYIYEFLKDKFNETYPTNPGKLVTARGSIRQPAFHALQKLFAEIKTSTTPRETPALYARSNPSVARGNLRTGALSMALYDLASAIPIRWIPTGTESLMKPGIPVLNPDGSMIPANENLSRLFSSIPSVDSRERLPWKEKVIALIRSLKGPIKPDTNSAGQRKQTSKGLKKGK